MICLTFDTDWMSEEGLAEFLDRYELPGTATFFAHQPYACLSGGRHEVGPHPFISNLDDWRGDLSRLKSSLGAPTRGTRTHSCVFSHMVGVGLAEDGYEYVSQSSNLYADGLKPFRHPWGLWELPIFYMDNMDFWMARNWPDLGHTPFDKRWIDVAVAGEALYVFDFHPLHVELNTRGADDYQAVKHRIVGEGVLPSKLAFPGRGTRTYFEELLREMSDAGVPSSACGAAIDAWRPGR